MLILCVFGLRRLAWPMCARVALVYLLCAQKSTKFLELSVCPWRILCGIVPKDSVEIESGFETELSRSQGGWGWEGQSVTPSWPPKLTRRCSGMERIVRLFWPEIISIWHKLLSPCGFITVLGLSNCSDLIGVAVRRVGCRQFGALAKSEGIADGRRRLRKLAAEKAATAITAKDKPFHPRKMPTHWVKFTSDVRPDGHMSIISFFWYRFLFHPFWEKYGKMEIGPKNTTPTQEITAFYDLDSADLGRGLGIWEIVLGELVYHVVNKHGFWKAPTYL